MEEFPLADNYEKVCKSRLDGLYKRKDGVDIETWPEYVIVKGINKSDKQGDKTDQDYLMKKMLANLTLVWKMNKDNIVECYGFTKNGVGELLLVMEACQGNLEVLIQSGRQLNTKELSFLAKQMLNGLCHLNFLEPLDDDKSLDFCNEVKPANVLMKVKGISVDTDIDWKTLPVNDITLKLSSFGLQNYLTDSDSSPFLDKFSWLNSDDGKLEIYSIGAILCQLATGESYPQTALPKLWRDNLDTIELISFLYATLPIESELRINLKELRQHPFITGREIDGFKCEETINWINFLERHIVLGNTEGSLYAIDLRTLEQTKIGQLKDGIHTMTYESGNFDYRHFAIADIKGKITVWSLEGEEDNTVAKCVKTIDDYEGSTVRCLRLSNRYLMELGDDWKIVVHKYESWEKLWELDFRASEKFGIMAQSSKSRETDQHKMVMVGNEIFVAEGEHLKRYVNSSGGHKLEVDLSIRGAKITCICMGSVDKKDHVRFAKSTRDSGRCFWLGTEDGKILQANLNTKSVWREIQVWNKGFVKQVIAFTEEYLICCITESNTLLSSVLCYEVSDLPDEPTDQVIPFRQIADFGCITSEIIVKGHQHLMFYNGGIFNHFVVSDINGIKKITELMLHQDFKK